MIFSVKRIIMTINRTLLAHVWALVLLLTGYSCESSQPQPIKKSNTQPSMNQSQNTDTAIFAAGCFWCVEAVFQQLQGVDTVISGYIGGQTENPDYESVCTGKTGHAEACQIIYHPDQISFKELCEIFYVTHDPTTLNRQGADVGTQYRSGIFYLNDEQKIIAQSVKEELQKSAIYKNPVVTEITAATRFYPAEDYHQNYFNLNKDRNPYCQAVIVPKLKKFQDTFRQKLKTNL